jgi:hypothetical protein
MVTLGLLAALGLMLRAPQGPAVGVPLWRWGAALVLTGGASLLIPDLLLAVWEDAAESVHPRDPWRVRALRGLLVAVTSAIICAIGFGTLWLIGWMG